MVDASSFLLALTLTSLQTRVWDSKINLVKDAVLPGFKGMGFRSGCNCTSVGVCPGWQAANASLASDVIPFVSKALASAFDSATSSALLFRAGKITVYLEYKTRSHKIARLVQKQGLSMPLVAPARGVGKTPWVLEFVKVSKLAERPLDTLHNVPLLPAPTEQGGWTNMVDQHTRGQEVASQCFEQSFEQRPRNDHDPLPEKHCPQLGWDSRTEC